MKQKNKHAYFEQINILVKPKIDCNIILWNKSEAGGKVFADTFERMKV
jgi:hypothetical protein